MENIVLEVQNLKKCYGSLCAVNSISFSVDKGEVFGLLGPNGAGKTTTVEMIEGLRTADSGSIKVLGMDVSKVPSEVKQRIGIQLQSPSLISSLTISEILDLFGSFYKDTTPVDKLIDMLSLNESKKVMVKNLSGGQQQRLSVAMALVNDPDIAFLDEPTTGLDPQVRREMWEVIENMKAQGKTIFLTTHYMEEAERLCDRVAIIDHGKIINMGSPLELINENFIERAIQFTSHNNIPLEDIKALNGVTSVMEDEGEYVIYSSNVTKMMSALLKYAGENNLGDELKDLHVRRATLEDVFLKLTGRKIRE